MWYQKECSEGELYNVFQEVNKMIPTDCLFDCSQDGLWNREKKIDADILRLVVRKLSMSAVSATSNEKLTVEASRFVWERGAGAEEEYCLCRKMTNGGWLLEVGVGKQQLPVATNLGWRKLSYDHPLADVVAVGPSHHANLCRQT